MKKTLLGYCINYFNTNFYKLRTLSTKLLALLPSKSKKCNIRITYTTSNLQERKTKQNYSQTVKYILMNYACPDLLIM